MALSVLRNAAKYRAANFPATNFPAAIFPAANFQASTTRAISFEALKSKITEKFREKIGLRVLNYLRSLVVASYDKGEGSFLFGINFKKHPAFAVVLETSRVRVFDELDGYLTYRLPIYAIDTNDETRIKTFIFRQMFIVMAERRKDEPYGPVFHRYKLKLPIWCEEKDIITYVDKDAAELTVKIPVDVETMKAFRKKLEDEMDAYLREAEAADEEVGRGEEEEESKTKGEK